MSPPGVVNLFSPALPHYKLDALHEKRRYNSRKNATSPRRPIEDRMVLLKPRKRFLEYNSTAQTKNERNETSD